MTSVDFTPLLGVGADDPFCFLLEVDGFKILLDCGWDLKFDEKALEPLAACAKDIDMVLLSHPDIMHLGSLPHAFARLGMACPVYGSLPVKQMGELCLRDALKSCPGGERAQAFTEYDIRMTFERVTALNYSQEIRVSEGKGKGVTLTPYNAGHMIGGTIWKIEKESEVILYAVSFNHRRERHLNRFVLETFKKPSLLITDALNMSVDHLRRKQLDQRLVAGVERAMARGGDVLIPVDASARVLELLLCLQQLWTQRRLSDRFSLVFFGHTAARTLELARSQVEWMSDHCMKQINSTRINNPFKLPDVACVHAITDLYSVRGPRCILATGPYGTTGFSADLLQIMSHDPNNLILFPQRGPSYTVSAQLSGVVPAPREVVMGTCRRVQMTDEEVKAEAVARAKQGQVEENANEDEGKGPEGGAETKADATPSDASKGDDGGDATAAAPAGATSSAPAAGTDNAQPKKRAPEEPARPVRKKRKRARLVADFPMFRYEKRKLEFDDYGEVIDRKDFEVEEDGSSAVYRARAGPKSAGGAPSAPTIPGSIGPLGIPGLGSAARDAQAVAWPLPPPSVRYKTVWEEKKLQISCSVLFVDFEGLADSRAIRETLRRVQPRRVVVVHAAPQDTTALKTFAEKTLGAEAFAPAALERQSVLSDMGVVQVEFDKDLLQGLEFQKVDQYGVAWLDAELGTADKDSDRPYPVLQQVSPAQAHRVMAHPALFLGNVKLAGLSRVLNGAGVDSEFSGGIMECSEKKVNIRKISPTQISIQGALTPEYFKIRSLLYKQYAVI